MVPPERLGGVGRPSDLPTPHGVRSRPGGPSGWPIPSLPMTSGVRRPLPEPGRYLFNRHHLDTFRAPSPRVSAGVTIQRRGVGTVAQDPREGAMSTADTPSGGNR